MMVDEKELKETISKAYKRGYEDGFGDCKRAALSALDSFGEQKSRVN